MSTQIIAIFFSLLLAFEVAATPFYRETFNRCDASEDKSVLAEKYSLWRAVRGGSYVGRLSQLKVSYLGAFDPLTAINSNQIGAEPGFAFWAKNTIDLSVVTSEISFNVTDLNLVQYHQRLGGKSADGTIDETRLIFRIADKWYISGLPARQVDVGEWELVSFSPRDLRYGIVKVDGAKGATYPSSFTFQLPEKGIVSAFGVFLPKVNGRVRIDNFTLSDMSPLPVTAIQNLSMIECFDNEILDDDNLVFGDPTFCPASQLKAAGKVKSSVAHARSVIQSIRNTNVESLRDRAILSVLLLNRLRVGDLFNLKVKDFYEVDGLSFLKNRGGSSFAMNSSAARSIKKYLIASDLKGRLELPMFQNANNKGSVNNIAMCRTELLKVVKKSFKKAGFSQRGLVTK